MAIFLLGVSATCKQQPWPCYLIEEDAEVPAEQMQEASTHELSGQKTLVRSAYLAKAHFVTLSMSACTVTRARFWLLTSAFIHIHPCLVDHEEAHSKISHLAKAHRCFVILVTDQFLLEWHDAYFIYCFILNLAHVLPAASARLDFLSQAFPRCFYQSIKRNKRQMKTS